MGTENFKAVTQPWNDASGMQITIQDTSNSNRIIGNIMMLNTAPMGKQQQINQAAAVCERFNHGLVDAEEAQTQDAPIPQPAGGPVTAPQPAPKA